MRKILTLCLVGLLLFSGCKSNSPTASASGTVRISQSLIDAGIAECQGKTDWGISFGVVRTNYVAGVTLIAPIILHNGDDAERLVTITAQKTFTPKPDTEYNKIYLPSPALADKWIKPSLTSVRLSTMETKAVDIELLVPAGTELPTNWEVDINADGAAIEEFEQKLLVETVDNDTTLSFYLKKPLLEGISSIISIASEIDEEITASEYNPQSSQIKLEGLQPNQKRVITITYECSSMVTKAYNQLWFITMLK